MEGKSDDKETQTQEPDPTAPGKERRATPAQSSASQDIPDPMDQEIESTKRHLEELEAREANKSKLFTDAAKQVEEATKLAENVAAQAAAEAAFAAETPVPQELGG